MDEHKPDPHKPTNHSIGSLIGGAIDTAVGGVGTVGRSVGSVGRLVGSALHLPGLSTHANHKTHYRPGAVPGIENAPDVKTPPPPDTVYIQCIDYSPDRVEITEVKEFESFLTQERPEWVAVRWINIDGLHPYVIHRASRAVGMHTLAAEDVLHVPQRPRVEPYDGDLFIIARMMRLIDDKLTSEQISLFMRRGLVVTFQETHGDVWQPIRERIHNQGSRLRTNDQSYLVYALLDAIVDHCFPILERYGDLLEELEAEVLGRPDAEVLSRIHGIKRELSVLRRVMWPMREVISVMRETELGIISDISRTYLRDVYEHTVQIVEIIETFREVAGGLTDLHMSAVSNRMNETMKVLTIMASLFIPITFLAGVYGMNFEYIPELGWRYGYPAFLCACLGIVGGLLWYFRRKGWLGGG